MRRLVKIWKNRKKIWEGIRYTYFPEEYVERIAQRRLEICRSNQCGLYDAEGRGEICVKKGGGCCLGCGCNDVYKSHSLSSHCSLQEQGKLPLWGEEMTEKEEKEFRDKTGIKNE